MGTRAPKKCFNLDLSILLYKDNGPSLSQEFFVTESIGFCRFSKISALSIALLLSYG